MNLPLRTTGQHKLQTHCKPCACTFAQWICVAVLKAELTALACRQGCNTPDLMLLSKLYGKYILEAVVVSILNECSDL